MECCVRNRSVADLLRGDYKQSEYGKVILPFTVLRRMDCVLGPTREAVLERAKELRKPGIHNMELLLTRVSKVGFYNTTKLDFAAITAATENGTLRSAALVNDEENFGLVFDQLFDEVVIERNDDNGKLLRRYFDDDAFRTRITDLARREAYRMIRGQHNVA